jgi:tripartite-type tricarboxylate transporter receptor subunit TctC
MRTMRIVAAAFAAGLLAFAYPAALAQDAAYPTKMIKVVVPFPPGGATDIMTRNIAQKLNESWKQPVVVDNKAGANGMIGADAVAKGQADGYTLLAATIAHSSGVSLFPKAPYQLQKDLRLAAIMGLIPLVPVVRADSPIRSLKDLVATSKNKPLNGGSGGNGTAAHLGLELFKVATGANIQHVPYKGGAPAMVDLLGGQIDVIFALVPECLPYVKSGKLRALAVTSDKRFPLLPDVPTTSEAGIPGIEVASWNGLMVPAATPREIVAKINAEVARIVEVPEMKSRIIELGYQPAVMSVGDTDKFIKADVDRWAKVIREAGIKAD